MNYAKNGIVNSCNNFENPDNFRFEEEGWLVLYGDAQGVCFWAINKRDFNKESQPVYLSFGDAKYYKEANSFEDFLVVRASLDYGQLLYPYRMISKNISLDCVEKVYELFNNAKSEVSIENLYDKKVFWHREDEVLWISTMGYWGLSINLNSKRKESIIRFQNLFPSLHWEILRDRTII